LRYIFSIQTLRVVERHEKEILKLDFFKENLFEFFWTKKFFFLTPKREKKEENFFSGKIPKSKNLKRLLKIMTILGWHYFEF